MESTASEVRSLLAAGKCKQAVELAKEHHKKMPGADSQQLLVQSYVGRIQQFQTKGMQQEAQTLISLVEQRYPGERHQLQALKVRALADGGDLAKLLAPLASEDTPPEARAQIEVMLARHVTDLQAVAGCASLPVDHAVRTSAAAIVEALTAVTTRPVTDEEIALPVIARRSPFSAWKLLIRAIALFYRSDDTGCRRTLDAIPGDSAVAHAAAALRQMVDEQKPSTGIASVLYSRARLNDQPLRAALDQIDYAMSRRDAGALQHGVREAVRQCTACRPEMLERMLQHLSVVAMINEFPVQLLVPAFGSAVKNAYFWRLYALSSARMGDHVMAAMGWERFLCHAVHEKMFEPASAEAAVVWLHIGEQLSSISPHRLERFRDRLASSRGLSSWYDDQPVEIRRLRPSSDEALARLVLSPGAGFEQAARIRPQAQTFTKWMDWAVRFKLPDKALERIARLWSEKRPSDVQPLLILASLAESRKALATAVRAIEQAETVDPLNENVRRARVRLTLAITWRHFAERKTHLVEKDLSDLTHLPAMTDGNRAAVLESIRAAWHQMRGDPAAEHASFKDVADRLGFLAASLIFRSVKSMARLDSPTDANTPTEDAPLECAKAVICALGIAEELKLKIALTPSWFAQVKKVLAQRPCPLSNAELFLLGRGLVELHHWEAAYLTTSAGLSRSNPSTTTARFLLLRASTFTEYFQRQRTVQCLRAALALARQANDQDLVGEIFKLLDRDPSLQRLVTSREGSGLPPELLPKILEQETCAEKYPLRLQEGDKYLVREALPDLFELFRRGSEIPWDDVGDDDADEDDDMEFFGFESGLMESDDDDDFVEAGPDGFSPDFSFEQMQQLMRETGVSDPARIMDNPKEVVKVMAKMLGRKINDAEARIIGEQVRDAVNSGQVSPPVVGKANQKNTRRP